MLKICIIFISFAVQAAVQSRLWTEGTFPEQSLPSLNKKSNTGIAISGGGSRSMACAIGEIRALMDLGLMDDVRYISTISGGSWATVGYLFNERVKSHFGITDADFLGEIIPPEKLTMDNLRKYEHGSFRKELTKAFISKILRLDLVDHWNEVWLDFIQYWLFDFLQIKPGTLFTFDENTEADIKKRNPDLANRDFVLSDPDKPYWIAGFILTGPKDFAPFKSDLSRGVFLEGSPLSVGSTKVVVKSYDSQTHGKTGNYTLGGMIEPFLFGTKDPKFVDGGEFVSVPKLPPVPFALQNLTAASSFFLSGFTARYMPHAVDIYDNMNYWSPFDESLKQTDYLLGDGGCIENNGLIGLIARGVTNIVMFANSDHGLTTRDVWDPVNGGVKDEYFPDSIFTYFGIAANKTETFFYDDNQVFPRSAFTDYVHGLQDSITAGNGAVYTTKLTTVANPHWGIPAGMNIRLTTMVLQRAFNWEKAVTDIKVKAGLYFKNETNCQSKVSGGVFKNFPFYSTYTDNSQSIEQANLLANFCGWTVLNNADQFKQTLSPNARTEQ